MGKKYAVLATLEWSDRADDGTLTTTRVEAGDVREDLPTDSIQPLLEGKAIEPFDRAEHKPGWYQRRHVAELDKATVKAGGVPRAEMTDYDRDITVGDTGSSEESR